MRSAPNHQGAKRILIVQEDKTLCMSLKVLVETAGYEVMGTATSIAEMAMQMAIFPPDIAIVDQSGDGSVAFQAVAFLERQGVPFVFVGSRCTDRAMPPSLADVPRLGGRPWAGDVLDILAATLAAESSKS